MLKAKLILLAALLICSAMPLLAQADKKAVKSKSNITNNRASVAQTLMDKEKAAWKNLVDKKYDDFGKALAEDYQSVYGKSRNTKATEFEGVKQTSFKSAEVTDLNVQMVNDNTGIVTALVVAETVGEDGVSAFTTFRTTSVFDKRGQVWLCVFHTDEPLETKK